MDWWGADVYVEFAWGDAPLTPDASCTWVDETAYVRKVATNRGRQSELSAVSPGTFAVSLDNSTRRFDSSNTSGPHVTELLPMTKVRFRAGAASAVTVFSGFVLGWPITYPGMTDSVVTVQCVDAMRVLEQSETPSSAYATAVLADSPSYYWPMQEVGSGTDAMIPAAAGGVDLIDQSVSFGSFVTTTGTWPVGEVTAVTTSDGSTAREGATIAALTSTPVSLEVWASTTGAVQVRAAASTTDYMAMIVSPAYVRVYYSNSVSNKRASSVGYMQIDLPSDTGQRHIVADLVGTTITLYVNGLSAGTVALEGGTYAITWSGYSPGVQVSAFDVGDTLSHFAIYSASIAARIRTHYEAGTIAHGHPMGERTGERIARILDTIGVDTDTLGTLPAATGNVYVPGTSGNYLSVPDSAALDITGDMTVMTWINPDTWAPSAAATILGKWLPTGNQRSWLFQLSGAGRLLFVTSTDGTANSVKTSTVSPTHPTGTGLWLAATLDADNGAAGHDVRFWQAYGSPSTVPTSWTQVGSTVTTAGVVAMYSGTGNVQAGTIATGTQMFAGTYERAIIATGIGALGVPGGTTVLDIYPTTDCPTVGAASFTATTGQTVTVATSGSPATTITPARTSADYAHAIQPGSTVCGQWEPDGANALSQIRALEDLEQGLFFIAGDGAATFRDRNWLTVNTRAITPRVTFGDSGSEVPYGDIEIDGNHLEHIRNTVTVTYPGAAITVKDATSRAAYGIQADSVDASQLPTWGGWLARQLASFRLRTRKDPATRIPTLQVDPRASSNFETTLDALVGLELGDRVRVIRRPNGSTDPIQKDCHVQGIAHTVTPANWSTTLYLSPAPQSYSEAGNLLAGDATYGIVGAGYESRY